jgi:non-ribosomal peptide synthetase component F
MDSVLHHTSVTFDVHLSEIAGTLIMGGQVILLHPNGNLSMTFFSETIARQQVTYLNIVPSLLIILIDYLRTTNNKECLKTLRCILFGGKKQYQNIFLYQSIVFTH